VNLFSFQVRRSLVHAFFFSAIAALLLRSAFMPILVSGASMSPSLRSGQLRIANRLAYLGDNPQRGDVVAVKIKQTGELLLKRVIGLPGEQVSMYSGAVFINHAPLDEPYVRFSSGLTMPPLTLEQDEYWVIGDYRKVSVFGIVYLDEIIAKAIL